MDSPLKNLDEDLPSFIGLMHHAIDYFSETSTLYSDQRKVLAQKAMNPSKPPQEIAELKA